MFGKSIVSIIFFVLACIPLYKIRKIKGIQNKGIQTKGILFDIEVKNKYSIYSSYCEATLEFVTKDHFKVRKRITRKVETVDFLIKHLGDETPITVYYDSQNPYCYLIKEMTLSLWRYYFVSGICFFMFVMTAILFWSLD